MVLKCVKSTSTLFTAGKSYPVQHVVSEYDNPVKSLKYQVKSDLGSTVYCALESAKASFKVLTSESK